jgi:cysteine synthase A
MADSALCTPLFQASEDVFLKCEFLHPGRSHKARVARALIEDAEKRNAVFPGGSRILLERTGGNLGIALAIEARIRGYKLELVTDPGYSAIKKGIAHRFGATVIDRGVDYPDCQSNQDVIDILLDQSGKDYLYLNQFGNPANPMAHEQGTGAEILAQLVGRGYGRNTPVILVSGLGTGATMRGVSAALRTWFRRVLTFAVQPASCDILRNKYSEHAFQGIAVGEPPPFYDVLLLDRVISVSENEGMDAVRQLARKYRFDVGPTSGANYAALRHAREQARVERAEDPIFVTFLYDRGEDYE